MSHGRFNSRGQRASNSLDLVNVHGEVEVVVPREDVPESDRAQKTSSVEKESGVRLNGRYSEIVEQDAKFLFVLFVQAIN